MQMNYGAVKSKFDRIKSNVKCLNCILKVLNGKTKKKSQQQPIKLSKTTRNVKIESK